MLARQATAGARTRAPAPRRARAGRPAAVVRCAAEALKPGHQNSKWPTGVPPVMGEHLMPSGEIAPVSRTKGPNDNEPHMFVYPSGEQAVSVTIHADKAAVAAALVAEVEAAAAAAIAAKGSFSLAIPGGSTIELMEGLAGAKVDWANTWVFFADERCVPLTDADSNCAGAMKGFLGKVGVPEAQVAKVDGGLPAETEAALYEARLKGCPAAPAGPTGFPAIDLVVLGMGPDAHVASLFPNHVAISKEDACVVAVTDSPKPPASRISLTMPVLNSAAKVVFPMAGKGKAEAVERVLEYQSLPGALPAQLVRPAGGVAWLLDRDAASDLKTMDWADPKKWPRSEVPAPPKPAAKVK